MSDLADLTLRAGGAEARILAYGARLASLRFADGPVLLTYPSDEANVRDDAWLGAALGRTSGRIKDARLTVKGRAHRLDANAGHDHLHGGAAGFGHTRWDVEAAGAREAVLTRTSPDGDQGYPGRLDARCRFALAEDRLTITYEAVTDAVGPVSLSHHPYYRLGGDADQHTLRVDADAYVPLDGEGLPTGEVRDVTGTPLDLRAGRGVADVLADLDAPLDHCLVCGDGVNAWLEGPAGCLRINADQPCLQVYGGGKLSSPLRPGAGLALEPQAYPDAERCGFPSRLVAPGEAWRRTTVIARG